MIKQGKEEYWKCS